MVVELSQVVEAVVVRRDEKDKWVCGGVIVEDATR